VIKNQSLLITLREPLPQTDRKFLWTNLVIYMLLGLFIQANITDPIEAFIQIFVEIFITLIFLGAYNAFNIN
jgi:hypothetical protein